MKNEGRRRPDFGRSLAVLIGVSEYLAPSYNDVGHEFLGSAANSLSGMRDLLADPVLCGWPSDRIMVIQNPASAAELAVRLHKVARDISDVLLVYFVGHGELTAKGELCLTVTTTDPEYVKATSLRYDLFRDALLTSPARTKAVILDCCGSGRAIPAVLSSNLLAVQAAVAGTYVLTAAHGNGLAHRPQYDTDPTAPTTFTGQLIDLVRNGIVGKPEWLTFYDLYPALRARLSASGFPEPNQINEHDAHSLAVSRNPQWSALDNGPDQEVLPDQEPARWAPHIDVIPPRHSNFDAQELLSHVTLALFDRPTSGENRMLGSGLALGKRTLVTMNSVIESLLDTDRLALRLRGHDVSGCVLATSDAIPLGDKDSDLRVVVIDCDGADNTVPPYPVTYQDWNGEKIGWGATSPEVPTSLHRSGRLVHQTSDGWTTGPDNTLIIGPEVLLGAEAVGSPLAMNTHSVHSDHGYPVCEPVIYRGYPTLCGLIAKISHSGGGVAVMTSWIAQALDRAYGPLV